MLLVCLDLKQINRVRLSILALITLYIEEFSVNKLGSSVNTASIVCQLLQTVLEDHHFE